MQAPEELAAPDRSADLATILAAWNSATLRLQQTHEALRDEVARLSDELAIKNRELARKNRLADLGQISSHVAHEVRNNLVPVKLYMSLLRRRLASDADGLSILDKVMSGVTALDATVEDLLHFAADRDPHREPLRLAALIEEIRTALTPQFTAQGVDFVIDIPEGLQTVADRNMIRRAAFNIVLNSLDAMPQGGLLTVAGREHDSGIELQFSDTGNGLAHAEGVRIFEPFYTTKSNGTGLGLAIVDHIAQVHGGTVVAQNGPQGGAQFTIQLPHQAQEALAA